MQCSKCQAENRDARRFCAECGTPLQALCPDCSFANDPADKFCGGCGKAMAPPVSSEDATSMPLPAGSKETQADTETVSGDNLITDESVAERRHISVMFCDLVGSTELSCQLDPEDLGSVVRSYQDAVGKVVARYDGFIAKYMGDAVIVYFGYPRAHEGAALCAIYTGLEIVEAIQKFDTRQVCEKDLTLAVRIGIDTGLVVVGQRIGKGPSEEVMVVGETPNMAARIHALAYPNNIVISQGTKSLAEGVFNFADNGIHKLKGFSEPVQAWRVLGKSVEATTGNNRVLTRFEAKLISGLLPMVGREEEVALLKKRWGQAKDGDGQVVLLVGEGGIGKSRIVHSFRESVEGESNNLLMLYCSSYYQNSAFYPVISYLEDSMRFDRNDSPVQKLNKVEAFLSDLNLNVEHFTPLFASLLSVSVSDRYPSFTFSRGQLKKNIIMALVTMFETMSSQRPVIMVVEDTHLIDPSTIELINTLIDDLQSGRIFLILTSRPEVAHHWENYAHVNLLTLSRMSRKEVMGIVKKVTEGKSLPDEVLDKIINRTDGVPLFVEELTRTLIESGVLQDSGDRFSLSGSLQELSIPESLQDSLMARLDNLSQPKQVAQLAAVVGRTFSYDLLAAVSPLDKKDLDDSLAKLVEAVLIYCSGSLDTSDLHYEFKHAMVQDVAYQSLLNSTSKQYHKRIAQLLEIQFPETTETAPELLAHHYTEANLYEQAINYWEQAGKKAVGNSANLEAIDHLRKGLKLLETFPDTPKRTEQELQLQITLAVPLTATSGYAASDVEQVYKRAYELCRQIGEDAQHFPALYGMWRYHCLRAEYETALKLGDELITLAENVKDRAFLIASHRALGSTYFYLGQLSKSRLHLDHGIGSSVAEQGSTTPFIKEAYDVIAPHVTCRSYKSWVLWLLGYPDQALHESHEAIRIAEEINHPFSVALAGCFAAWLHQFSYDGRRTLEYADAALAISTKNGFPFWIGWAKILRGWALAELGQEEDVIAQMQQGLADWRAQGSQLGSAYFRYLSADVFRIKEKSEEGLEALDEAQVLADKTKEHFWDAERFRLKGELQLQLSGTHEDSAESCFQQALDLARQQQMKSLELRAALSLSRLWCKNGKQAEAREMFEPIYSWFTEGFNTADLKEAKGLISSFETVS